MPHIKRPGSDFYGKSIEHFNRRASVLASTRAFPFVCVCAMCVCVCSFSPVFFVLHWSLFIHDSVLPLTIYVAFVFELCSPFLFALICVVEQNVMLFVSLLSFFLSRE